MEENRFKLARTTHNRHGKQSVMEVAKGTGISKTLIDDLESSLSKKRGTSYLTVKKLAEYYGVSSDYLLGLTEHETPNAEIRAICEYTGLSEKSVECLHTRFHMLPTLQHDCFDLLNWMLGSEIGAKNLLVLLVSASSHVKKAIPAQLNSILSDKKCMDPVTFFSRLERLRKDIIAEKVDAQDLFNEFFETVTDYSSCKRKIDSAIQAELEIHEIDL